MSEPEFDVRASNVQALARQIHPLLNDADLFNKVFQVQTFLESLILLILYSSNVEYVLCSAWRRFGI